MATVILNSKPVGFDSKDITIGLTGPDWEPTIGMKYYAQKGSLYAFGKTELEALQVLLKSIP